GCQSLPLCAHCRSPPGHSAELIEEIDIGGPTLLRAAAKNFSSVAVVLSPDDYPRVIEELQAGGQVSLATRLELARKVFAATAAYDATIARTLEEVYPAEVPKDAGGVQLLRKPAHGFPAFLSLAASKAMDLRYGENPHQRAALYRIVDLASDASAPAGPPAAGHSESRRAGRGIGSSPTAFGIAGPAHRGLGVGGARQLQGKELSYNNLLDLDAAWDLANEFEEPSRTSPQGEPVAVIIKHTNPCGVAVGRPDASGQAEAYEKAYACDPVSAYGSVLGFNQPLSAATAEAISKRFVEAIAAPAYEPAALDILARKKNLRLVEVSPPAGACTGVGGDWRLRSIAGGLLLQEIDRSRLDPARFRVVTKRPPSAAELQALLFAWLVAKHVKSNAIVYARDGQTVGIGAGQMSRVDSVKLGAQKAQLLLQGTVLASDAFFPFPDGIEEAAKVGVTAVIQPGGSVRDAEVIAAADRLGLAMVFTGIRHFRH
ncbi:MAG: bifunctional phosphoribosylaminoimidazolecarboxamide formyltransferase/inosine monophosphate cyclohydrolase, partial [Acidobacteriota bacterium]